MLLTYLVIVKLEAKLYKASEFRMPMYLKSGINSETAYNCIYVSLYTNVRKFT